MIVSDMSVAILGGGQLARMLVEAAARLGLSPIVLAESADAPAAKVSPRVIVGTIAERDKIEQLLAAARIVVFENEFVDTDALAAIAGPARADCFRPGLATLARLRDKLEQKRLLRELGVATSRFHVFAGDDLDAWMHESIKELGGPVVLKWGRLGYDGKGVFFLDDPRAQAAAARDFAKKATDRGIPLFAEARVAFRRELALVAVRSMTGEFMSYGLVVSEQHRGICWNVSGPATSLGVSPARETEAQTTAKRVAEAAGIVGCFAIEFFETQDGGLWVNEMAPRVHNSGHYTQDACATSQFENHWRGVLGAPLGAPRPRGAFMMGNVLGPEGVDRAAKGAPLPIPTAGVHLHWYGKEELRAGRKLGHLNAAADDIGELPKLVAEVDACRTAWAARLKEDK